MISSWFSSLGNNLVQRSKNPFLGTFFLVWIARNWELVFALFNFDDKYTLETKITFLTERIKYDAFWAEFGWNILWTFTILIITYIMINLARIISNLFEKRLTPIIMKLTDYNSLVPKSEYQGVLTRMNDLQERLDRETQERIRVQNERDKTEEEVNRLNLEIKEMDSKTSSKEVENRFEIKELQTKYLESLSDFIDKYGISDIYYALDQVRNKNPLQKESQYAVIGESLNKSGYLNKKDDYKESTLFTLTEEGIDLIDEIENTSELKTDSQKPNDLLIDNLLKKHSQDLLTEIIDKSLISEYISNDSEAGKLAKLLLRKGLISVLENGSHRSRYQITALGKMLAKRL